MMQAKERQALEKLSKRYASKGYEVLLDQDAQRVLPEDLQEFVPDMVVMKGDEKVIIEIKQLGVPRRELTLLSQRVQDHPPWRLDVHFVKSPETPVRVEPDEIMATAERARQLFSSGNRFAAFLVMWSAFEAASRAALSRDSANALEKVEEPASLIKLLVFEGLIDEQSHNRLMEIEKVRNLAAHGGLTVPVNTDDFDFLFDVARDLTSDAMSGSRPE